VEVFYLRVAGKYTCHGGINTAAGWVYPLAFLISNGWIRPYGCNSIRAAAEYFSKSCVPGALSSEYNTGVPYDNMCDLCHGASYRYCRRDASEDYYGHTGAFRCLVEGGGQVAFVTHVTVTQNTGGKREEWWARDNLNDDFELLCPDGEDCDICAFRLITEARFQERGRRSTSTKSAIWGRSRPMRLSRGGVTGTTTLTSTPSSICSCTRRPSTGGGPRTSSGKRGESLSSQA
jgi:hypothetical protein